VRNQQR